MPDIFGVDVAGIILEALGDGMFDQVLTKLVTDRDPSDSTKSIQVTTNHNCKGFISDYSKENSINGTNITDAKIVILGASLPAGVIPEPKDQIIAEGKTFVIQADGVVRDPASATYECRSR